MDLAGLNRVAGQVVAATQARFPRAIQVAAAGVPVCCEARPGAALLADGIEPDTLGLFVGHEHLGDLTGAEPFPPQILLFVENLWDLAEGDGATYRDEVRLTYLHEIGHYLGWDEDEIARRGLE